jgi:hypothetical protein
VYDLLEKRLEVKNGSITILDHIYGIYGICFKDDICKLHLFDYMLETVMHRLKAQQITRPIKMEYIQLRGTMTTVPYLEHR